jgi:amidase/aspartyl-tRNA(Asn)/glutamyl-tRNA(Gln) amidotransferase subunit A
MADGDQNAWASAGELGARIRRRELSPVELMRSTIQRIERRNPSLNAFVFTDFDQAIERARAAEAEMIEVMWCRLPM